MRHGIQAVARQEFLQKIVKETRQRGVKVITLKEKGMTPDELIKYARQRNLLTTVEGLKVTLAVEKAN